MPDRAQSVRTVTTPSAPPAAAPETYGELDRVLAFAFAPMHKRAFGVAIGTAAGLLLFAVTVASMQLDPADRANVALLSQFFAGYERSWRGAFVGLLWGLFVGFVLGWFTAFVRNLVLAVWLLILRMRADLDASREFLDHI
jgi:hypothetical protein